MCLEPTQQVLQGSWLRHQGQLARLVSGNGIFPTTCLAGQCCHAPRSEMCQAQSNQLPKRLSLTPSCLKMQVLLLLQHASAWLHPVLAIVDFEAAEPKSFRTGGRKPAADAPKTYSTSLAAVWAAGGFSKAAEKFALRQIWARKAMSHSNTGPVGRVEASGFQGVVQPIALRVQSLTRGAPAAFGMRCPVLRSGQTQIKRQHAPITKSHPSLLICSTRSRLAFGTKSDARCYSSLPPSVPRSLCPSMSQLGLSFCSLSARASSQGETGKSSKAGSGHRRAWSSSWSSGRQRSLIIWL